MSKHKKKGNKESQNIAHQNNLAEYIAANLVEKGYALDNIVIFPMSQFRRRYMNDIDKAIRIKNTSPATNLVYLYTNRDGLYDHLPEGIFHQNPTLPPEIELNDSLQQVQKKEQEEGAARNFFLAIERELYRQRIALELEERSSLKIFAEEKFTDTFFEFWSLDNSLRDDSEEKNTKAILHLLPLSHKLAGNDALMGECLSIILGCKVTVLRQKPTSTKIPEQMSPTLGSTTLGIDFILGGELSDGIPTVEISIEELPGSKLLSFLPGSQTYRMIEMLCELLVPLDCDRQININVQDEEKYFILSDDVGLAARLNYTTFL